jgi:hypothetical protein
MLELHGLPHIGPRIPHWDNTIEASMEAVTAVAVGILGEESVAIPPSLMS